MDWYTLNLTGAIHGVVASGLETAGTVAGAGVLANFVGTPPSA